MQACPEIQARSSSPLTAGCGRGGAGRKQLSNGRVYVRLFSPLVPTFEFLGELSLMLCFQPGPGRTS